LDVEDEDIRRLESMEIWIWRRMEIVSWTEKKINKEVFWIVGENRKLVSTVVTRKRKWIEHIILGESLMKDVLEGLMKGRMTRGRKRIGMLEELKEESFMIMKRIAKNTENWRDCLPNTCR